ncbi:MAG TPA: hypothetical protein VK742_02055, partial [Candidatus Sulfotelmatobacter sp.]|nr:hypothetical protein [Candidatus Sulfotelmatobacter sp.]
VVQEKPHLLIKPSHEFHPRVALAQSFIQFIPDMQGHPGYLSISCHNFIPPLCSSRREEALTNALVPSHAHRVSFFRLQFVNRKSHIVNFTTLPQNTPLRRAPDFHLFFPVEDPRPDRFIHKSNQKG